MKIRSIAVTTFKVLMGLELGIAAVSLTNKAINRVIKGANSAFKKFVTAAETKMEESEERIADEGSDRVIGFEEFINNLKEAAKEAINTNNEENTDGGEEDGSEA